MPPIDILHQTRQLTAAAVNKLTLAQWCAIPSGFDNNIAWNVGHILVTQQALCYRLSGLPVDVTSAEMAMYRTGTSPADWQGRQADLDRLKTLLLDQPPRLAADYAAGRFTDFKPYTTSTGVALYSIEAALAFNNFHEGLHLGAILALRNLVVQL